MVLTITEGVGYYRIYGDPIILDHLTVEKYDSDKDKLDCEENEIRKNMKLNLRRLKNSDAH
jgi:hypothetical protein